MIVTAKQRKFTLAAHVTFAVGLAWCGRWLSNTCRQLI